MSDTKKTALLIDNIEVLIHCEHCGVNQFNDDLGKNGTCKSCGKEIRENLF